MMDDRDTAADKIRSRLSVAFLGRGPVIPGAATALRE